MQVYNAHFKYQNVFDKYTMSVLCPLKQEHMSDLYEAFSIILATSRLCMLEKFLRIDIW